MLRSHITLEEKLKKGGWRYLHNIRFSSSEFDRGTFPTMEELLQEYQSRYGEGNFRFEKMAYDKGGKRLPVNKYRAVYVNK